MVKQRTGDVLRSADRLLRVLEWFSDERPNGTATEIARDLDIAPATVRRLLALLESHRFLQRDRDQSSYHIGYAPLRLASIARSANPLVRAARDELDRLQQNVGELVIVGILDGVDVVHVDTRDSTHPLRVHRDIGRRVRADEGGALGSVLLAWLDDESLDDLLGAPSTRTEEIDALVGALDQVRKRGYAINPGTAFRENIFAVAVPVRDDTGLPCAGLALVAPGARATKDRQRELIEQALQSAAVISERLGWMDGARAI